METQQIQILTGTFEGHAIGIVTRNLRDFREMELRFPNLRVLSPEDQLKEL